MKPKFDVPVPRLSHHPPPPSPSPVPVLVAVSSYARVRFVIRSRSNDETFRRRVRTTSLFSAAVGRRGIKDFRERQGGLGGDSEEYVRQVDCPA